MALDVALIVSPQAAPRGGVEQEGKGLERDGDADVQPSVGHVVVEGAGASLPAERAPEQARGVDARPEDERRGDEACRGRGQLLVGLWGLVRRRQGLPACACRCLPTGLRGSRATFSGSAAQWGKDPVRRFEPKQLT